MFSALLVNNTIYKFFYYRFYVSVHQLKSHNLTSQDTEATEATRSTDCKHRVVDLQVRNVYVPITKLYS